MSPRRLWKATDADALSAITCNARIGRTSGVFKRAEWKDSHGTWRQHLLGQRSQMPEGFDEELQQGLKRREEGEPDPTW